MDGDLAVTHASLSAWFEDWLAGVDLGKAMFEEDPERPAHILTVHGQGYRFAG